MLESIGIDTSHIKENIDNVFGEVKNKFKDTFSSIVSEVSESLGRTLSPIGDKFKSMFKSRPKPKKDADPQYEYMDENGATQTMSSKQSKYQEDLHKRLGIDPIGLNKKTLPDNYYDDVFNITEDSSDYFLDSLLRTGFDVDNERKNVTNLRNEIARLNIGLNSRGIKKSDRSKLKAQISKLQNNVDMKNGNILDYFKSIQMSADNETFAKYKNDVISTLVEDGYDNEATDNIINTIFNKHKKDPNGRDNIYNLTAKDMMTTARDLSISTGDNKYETVIDMISSKLDKDYKSDIDSNLYSIIDDIKANKLITQNGGVLAESEDLGLPKSSKEFYEAINYQGSILDKVLEVEDSKTPILNSIGDHITSIANDMKIFKDIILSSRTTSTNLHPRTPLTMNPAVLAHPEGKAMNTFAQDLVTMITNWMFGNVRKFDKGGYIEKPMVATVGAGEVILSADNVEKLTSIFNDLIGNIKSRTNKKEMTNTLTESLRSLNIEGVEKSDIPELFNNFVDNDMELNRQRIGLSHGELVRYKKAIGSAKNRGIKIDNIKSNYDKADTSEEDTPSLLDTVKDDLLKDFKDVKTALLGESPEKEKKGFAEFVDDTVDNLGIYAPDMLTSGAIGAGVSLLTGAIGGPLLGAAVGASIGLSKKSNKMQDWLFGEMAADDNGVLKRTGKGVIPRPLMDAINKYAPDMKDYGLLGTLAGFITPFGPIGGMMLGSAFGYAKNNEGVMSTLFGEDGLFKPESKDKLNKALPKILLGAGVSTIVGPFGLMGNLAMGSAIGLATSTNDFRQALLGRYDEKDNKFKGGIIPALRDHLVDPLKDFAISIKDGFVDNIKKHMFDPVKFAFKPLKKLVTLQIQNMFTGIKDGFNKAIGDRFVAPLTKKVEGIIKPIGFFVNKLVRFGVKAPFALATLPFKAIGGMGAMAHDKLIKSGDADYDTAEDRLAYAKNNIGEYDNKLFDETISKASVEDNQKLLDDLKFIKSNSVGKKQRIKDIGRETGDNVATYMSYGNTKDLMYYLNRGKLDKALSIIDKKTLTGKNKHGMSEDDIESLKDFIINQYNKVEGIDKDIEESDILKNKMFKDFKKLGLNLNDKNIGKYIGLVEKEVKSGSSKLSDDEIKELSTPEQIALQDARDRHNSITELFGKVINILQGVEENTEKIEDNQITEEEAKTIKRSESIPVHIGGGKFVDVQDKDGDGQVDDFLDPSDIRAINEVRDQESSKVSLFNKLLSMSNNKNDKSNSDDPKESIFSKIFKMGTLGKVVLGGLGVAGLGVFGPGMLDFAQDKLIPFVGDLWTGVLSPWINESLLPAVKGGILDIARNLPSIIGNSVTFAFTELFPAIWDGIKAFFNGDKSEDSVGESTKETIFRQIATGGALGDISSSGVAQATGDVASVGSNIVNGVGNGVDAAQAAVKSKGILGKIVNGAVIAPTKFASKLMTNLNPVVLATKTAVGTTKLGVKAASFGTKVASKGTNSIYKNINSVVNDKIIDGVNGFTSIANKLRGKDKQIAKVAEVAGNTNLVENALYNLGNKMSELISNPKIAGFIPEKARNSLLGSISKGFIDKIRPHATKQATKMASRIAGFTTTGGLVNIAFAVGDFISGWNDAKNILGIIEEPGIPYKFACGLLKAIKNFFVIGCLIPESMFANILIDWILGSMGMADELRDLRAQAKQKADEYKNNNNIKGSFSVRDLNNKIKEENRKANPKDANGDGRVGFFSDGFAAIGNAVKSAASSVGNFISSGFNKVKKFFTGKGGGQLAGGSGTSSSNGSYPTHLNKFKYYNQHDPQWNQQSIKGYSIKKAGCGPTSVAMLLSQILGRPISPIETATEGANTGHWSNKGAQWTLFKHLGDKYGVPVQDAKQNFDTFTQFAKMGIPQAVSGRGKAPFTSGGHIITVLGADENGNAIVNDPNKVDYSKVWTLDQLKANGWRNSWAYGDGTPVPTVGNIIDSSGNNIQEQTIQQQQSTNGFDMFLSDLSGAMSSTFNKMYGFDKLVGMGGESYDVNPLAATDFDTNADAKKVIDLIENDMMFATKVSGSINTSPSNNSISKSEINTLRNDLIKKSRKYNGMGGVDQPIIKPTKSDIEHQVLTKFTDITEAEFNNWLNRWKKPTSPFRNVDGNIFLSAANKTGLDPRYIMAHAAWESGWGTSKIAKDKNNYYGIGAFNKSPYKSALTFNSASDGILAGAEWIKKNYIDRGQDTLNKMIFDPSGKNHTYATFDNGKPNTDWIKGITGIMVSAPQSGKIVTSLNTSDPMSGSTIAENGSTPQDNTQQHSNGFEMFMSDLSSLFESGFNKLYGFDKILPSDVDDITGNSEVNTIEIDPNSPKVADDWFTRVLNGRMTSPYGPRKHPVTGEVGKMHTGVDYGAGGGTPILSPVAGTVISNVSQSTGYGNHLRLQDEYGGVHLFAHMQKKSPLSVGSKVDLNDSVGVVGTTGSSTGNHLHYEIRKSDDKNAHVEPNGYLSAYLDKLYNKSKPKSQVSTGPRVTEKPKLDLKPALTPASLTGKGGVDSPINESNMFKNNVNSVQPQNNNLDKELLLAIIKVLEKIANNTNSLSEIVTLITKALNIPKDQIDKIEKTKESNPTQVINVIKDSIKGSDPSNTNLLNILNELAKQ